jgi:hypothetical protein
MAAVAGGGGGEPQLNKSVNHNALGALTAWEEDKCQRTRREIDTAGRLSNVGINQANDSLATKTRAAIA